MADSDSRTDSSSSSSSPSPSSPSPSLSDLLMTVPSEPYPLPPPKPDPFDFPCTNPTEMCAADEVIFQGELLPFGTPPPPKIAKGHRRANSMDRPSRCWSRRLSDKEYNKLRAPEEAAARPSSPRWYLFLFGPVRVPAEMEMSDIRTRQRRRSRSLEVLKREKDSMWGGPWKLLRSLSCKGIESAAAAAPLSFV